MKTDARIPGTDFAQRKRFALVAAIQGALGGLAFTLAGIGTAISGSADGIFFAPVPVVGFRIDLGARGVVARVHRTHRQQACLVAAIWRQQSFAGGGGQYVRPCSFAPHTSKQLLLFVSVLGDRSFSGLPPPFPSDSWPVRQLWPRRWAYSGCHAASSMTWKTTRV